MSIRISTVMFRFLGRCPKPQFLFCLDTKKKSKKVKAEPASHEKLTLDG
jgi:hypothetical protein